MNFGVTDKSVNLIKWTVTIKIIPDGETEKSKVKALFEFFNISKSKASKASNFLKKKANDIGSGKHGESVNESFEVLNDEQLKKMIKVHPSDSKLTVKMTVKKPGLLSIYKLRKNCFVELRKIIKAVYILLGGRLVTFPADLEIPLRNAVALVTGVGSQRKKTHWTTWSQGDWPPGV